MKQLDMNESRGISDKELYDFLPSVLEVTERPPNKVAQWITWSIIILFFSAIAWACIGKVDIVVTGRGVLQKAVDSKGNETFHATVQFQNKDVGFLKAGLPVALKVDAFRFTKYGMIDGVLGDIELEQTNRGMQNIFKSEVNDLRNKIVSKDKVVRLKNGMTLTAEVKMGDRRIIEYILSPIDKAIQESGKEQ
jgi:hypothetical protein